MPIQEHFMLWRHLKRKAYYSAIPAIILLYSLREMETLLDCCRLSCFSEEEDFQRLYSFIKRQMDAIVVNMIGKRLFSCGNLCTVD